MSVSKPLFSLNCIFLGIGENLHSLVRSGNVQQLKPNHSKILDSNGQDISQQIKHTLRCHSVDTDRLADRCDSSIFCLEQWIKFFFRYFDFFLHDFYYNKRCEYNSSLLAIVLFSHYRNKLITDYHSKLFSHHHNKLITHYIILAYSWPQIGFLVAGRRCDQSIHSSAILQPVLSHAAISFHS